MADSEVEEGLVVDDQKSMRGLVRFALLQMGMETSTAPRAARKRSRS